MSTTQDIDWSKCICGGAVQGYEGPREDCPIHGRPTQDTQTPQDDFKSGMDAYLMDKQPGGVNLFNKEKAQTPQQPQGPEIANAGKWIVGPEPQRVAVLITPDGYVGMKEDSGVAFYNRKEALKGAKILNAQQQRIVALTESRDDWQRIAEGSDSYVRTVTDKLRARNGDLEAALRAIMSRAARLIDAKCDHKWGDVWFGIKTPEPYEVLVNYIWRCEYCGAIQYDHGETVIRGDTESFPQNAYAVANTALLSPSEAK